VAKRVLKEVVKRDLMVYKLTEAMVFYLAK